MKHSVEELKEIIKSKNVKLDWLKQTSWYALQNVINVLGDNLTLEEAQDIYTTLRKGEVLYESNFN